MILKSYTIQERDKGKVIFQKFQMMNKETKEVRDMQIQQYVKGNIQEFINELEEKAQNEFKDKFENEYELI